MSQDDVLKICADTKTELDALLEKFYRENEQAISVGDPKGGASLWQTVQFWATFSLAEAKKTWRIYDDGCRLRDAFAAQEKAAAIAAFRLQSAEFEGLVDRLKGIVERANALRSTKQSAMAGLWNKLVDQGDALRGAAMRLVEDGPPATLHGVTGTVQVGGAAGGERRAPSEPDQSAPTPPPMTGGPSTEPPASEPPIAEPPVTAPPPTAAPVTEAPLNGSPITEPPVASPPETGSPATEPPTAPPLENTPLETTPPATTPPPVVTPPFTSTPVTSPLGAATTPPAPETSGGAETLDDAALEIAMVFLARWEDFRGLAYDDLDPFRTLAPGDAVKGTLTIGYGTIRYLDGAPVQIGDTMTEEDAKRIKISQIRKDYLPHIKKVPVWDDLNVNQRAALISFGYNVGAHFYNPIAYPQTHRALSSLDNLADFPGVAKQWNRAGGRFLQGLQNRRDAEMELWAGLGPYAATTLIS